MYSLCKQWSMFSCFSLFYLTHLFSFCIFFQWLIRPIRKLLNYSGCFFWRVYKSRERSTKRFPLFIKKTPQLDEVVVNKLTRLLGLSLCFNKRVLPKLFVCLFVIINIKQSGGAITIVFPLSCSGGYFLFCFSSTYNCHLDSIITNDEYKYGFKIACIKLVNIWASVM